MWLVEEMCFYFSKQSDFWFLLTDAKKCKNPIDFYCVLKPYLGTFIGTLGSFLKEVSYGHQGWSKYSKYNNIAQYYFNFKIIQ